MSAFVCTGRQAFATRLSCLARWFSAFVIASLTVGPATFAETNIFECGIRPIAKAKLDELVFAGLEKIGAQPANICSDSVFVRRAFLDVIGAIPTAEEAKAFIQSEDSNKRTELIETLLQRNEFADYWTMKWCDLLRAKSEFPINLWPNAVQAYHRWIFTSIRQNKPYDSFARELLTASGSNFRDPPVNFYRALQNRTPRGIAEMVALTFMGSRADRWPPAKADAMAAFFSRVSYKRTGEWKEEIVFDDVSKAGANSAQRAVFPDGAVAHLTPDKDPREVFADWMVSPENKWFARNIANRVWSWLMGRGIVHEPDDLRADNPPVNPELLAYLERELIESRYDLKHLYRIILNSQTYQFSSIPKTPTPGASANFAHYQLRRLEAETLIDAINDATWSTDRYSSPIPEPFTFLPDDMRAIGIPDGSITSPFLEMFGRPPRDTGLETERNNEPSAKQRLHLFNSSHVQRKIETSSTLKEIALSQQSTREIFTQFYLTILSRFPTEAELKAIESYSQLDEIGRRELAADVAWALINTVEFTHRH